jgi:hypothetical protein
MLDFTYSVSHDRPGNEYNVLLEWGAAGYSFGSVVASVPLDFLIGISELLFASRGLSLTCSTSRFICSPCSGIAVGVATYFEKESNDRWRSQTPVLCGCGGRFRNLTPKRVSPVAAGNSKQLD